MPLYVVGHGGGQAIPLAPGLPRIELAGTGGVSVALLPPGGASPVIVYTGKTEADALKALDTLVTALDPSAVRMAKLVP